ncbi:hypothetical protein T484DRAFT_1904624 [Baffinella frigidus]|nr:hypothetical protein T484DRAFT_1904624 [Cryptophyta sp. CCMP2293]
MTALPGREADVFVDDWGDGAGADNEANALVEDNDSCPEKGSVRKHGNAAHTFCDMPPLRAQQANLLAFAACLLTFGTVVGAVVGIISSRPAPETTPLPQPSETGNTIEMEVRLPMPASRFDAETRGGFKAAVAASARTSVRSVVLVSVTDVAASRRLMAGRIDVAFQATGTRAPTLTLTALNSELAFRGIPAFPEAGLHMGPT